MKRGKRSFVCFSSCDFWTSNPYAIVHTMKEFARDHKVLFINTVSPSVPRITSKSFKIKLLRKIPSLLRAFRKAGGNLSVLTPIALPFSRRSLVRKFNGFFLKMQIRWAMRLAGVERPVLWMANLYAVTLVEKIDCEAMVFVCTDKWDSSTYVRDGELLKRYDEILVEKSDVILCVSRELYKSYGKRAPGKVRYLPHAVEEERFLEDDSAGLEVPEEMKNLQRPIIGYYGSLTENNDIDLVADCARKRPGWSFVLIGRVTSGDYESLARLPNLHFLGFKSLDVLPSYARCFDVAIQFWKMTEWVRYSSPLKTKEYLALGKPVVSVPIPEMVTEFSDVVRTASGGEEFLAAIEEELAGDCPERRARRRERVRGDSWRSYAEKVFGILDGFSGPPARAVAAARK